MRPALWVALAAVTVLAGCTGAFAGEGTTATPERVTAAPVPEPTPGRVTLPRTADGTPDVGRIVVEHHQTVRSRSVHRRLVVDEGQSATDVWVDRDRDVVRVRQRFGRSTDDVVVVDGRRYTRTRDGEVAAQPTNNSLPAVDTASGLFVLQRHVAGLVYDRTGSVTRDGTRLAVVRANTTNATLSRGGFRTVVAADSRLYVDGRGVVRYLDHRERYADGSVRSLTMRVTTDVERVPLPEWVPVDPYAS
ncbi:hypothetical protein EGH21_11955 [Halomicroarcula sp. F13]|uniref:Lipoprotein n=1 Tax=Haloarcula rubra TaxID=2487747 RepID=A0AAW4PTV3_9EURY|nr:hypothetical protein [Halomicroarcula rubra]MBX0323742.1 hypothetical protein [Halomicroarcula rubra]